MNSATRFRSVATFVALVGALALAACGDEETITSTTTETVKEVKTTTVTEPAPETEPTTTTEDENPGSGEVSDLPPCSDGVLPCLNPDGTVTETPEAGGIDGGGETADLPLCSEGPPPCREPDGSVVEP